MLARRVIPCLDIRGGRVVKGVKFEGVRDVSDPVEAAAFYNSQGADEIVFYDIAASGEGRGVFIDLLREVSAQITVPIRGSGSVQSVTIINGIESGAAGGPPSRPIYGHDIWVAADGSPLCREIIYVWYGCTGTNRNPPA